MQKSETAEGDYEIHDTRSLHELDSSRSRSFRPHVNRYIFGYI